MIHRVRILDRTNVVLLIVLAALAGAYAATDRGSVFDESPEASLDLFPGFDAANAARIEIVEMTRAVKDGQNVDEPRRIEIAREGDVWAVTTAKGYPARPEKVQGLLEKIDAFKRGIVRSHNPQHHQQLGVDDSGRRCQVFDASGKALADVYVGKPAPDFRSTFIRRAGSDEVYVAPDNLAQVFGTMPTQWYENQIAPFKAEEAVAADLSYDDVHIRLEKDSEGTWKVVAPEEFVAEKRIAESLVRPAASLRFTAVAGKGSDGGYGLEDPSLRLEVKLGDGTTHAFRAGAETGERAIFIQHEGDEFVFEVSRPLIQTLRKKLDDFRPKAPDPPPPPPPSDEEPPKKPDDGEPRDEAPSDGKTPPADEKTPATGEEPPPKKDEAPDPADGKGKETPPSDEEPPK